MVECLRCGRLAEKVISETYEEQSVECFRIDRGNPCLHNEMNKKYENLIKTLEKLLALLKAPAPELSTWHVAVYAVRSELIFEMQLCL